MAFDVYDKNGDGKISHEELQAVLSLVRQLDTNSSTHKVWLATP